jgi:hypothetical protein
MNMFEERKRLPWLAGGKRACANAAFCACKDFFRSGLRGAVPRRRVGANALNARTKYLSRSGCAGPLAVPASDWMAPQTATFGCKFSEKSP